MKFSASLIALLLALPAFADVPTITSMSGVSRLSMVNTPTAFGGFGGAACVNIDLNSTCNSCVGGSIAACNEFRAYNALNFRISAVHSELGNLMLVRPSDFTLISAAPFNPNDVSVPWSTLCASFPGGVADCETSAVKEGTVLLCLDKNANNSYDTDEDCREVLIKMVQLPPGGNDKASPDDGITEFIPYPGDTRAFLEDLIVSANFPNLSHGGKITGVRIFPSDQGMTQAKPGLSLMPQDLPLQADNTLASNIVDGLVNGTPYWFRIALIDEANNVGYFWPPDDHVDMNGNNCDQGPCIYMTTPNPIEGQQRR